MTKLRYSKAQLKFFKEMGKLGGLKQKEKGSKYFSEIGKLGVQAREAKKLKFTKPIKEI